MRSSRMCFRALVGLGIAVGVTATLGGGAGPPSSGGKETLVRVISRWDDDCSGSQRDWWDDMCKAWYDAITDDSSESSGGHGGEAWVRGGFYHNGNIVDSDFTDPREDDHGRDDEDDNLDHADAYMVGLHGGQSGSDDGWYGKVRVNEPGDGDCKVGDNDLRLGNDYDLEFLHLSSCLSMDEENWWPEWNGAFDRLHQIDGFHGLMWIGSSLVDDYEEFADDAFDSSIADAWLDNMYIPDISDSDDQCPIPRGVGKTKEDLWDRMDHERYNNVYDDPVGRGEDRWHGVIYICDCDPAAKDKLDCD